MGIHPAAVVSPRAEIAEDVEIGPYSVIGEHVSIGRSTVVGSHVIIDGNTRIGERNRIYPFVTLGTPPQDVGYRGEDTRLLIGDDNIIREYATVHRATTKQEWVTSVGDRNYLMAYSHVAHDCILGNHVILANVATLGGHVHVGDHANLGGLAAVHQFVRIGAYAFVGGKSGVDRDVPPFMIIAGERAKLYGINRRGLRRQGLSPESIEGLKKAFQIIWRDNLQMAEGIRQAREKIPSTPELEMLLTFLESSKRGVLR
ncbi:MAG: acyl-ACP--UDP-N-acetylglucosamine O-acyltransferase [Desulfobacteraceae bacterium]|nr:MAG: acyl-ACP--UDP-N-acetylglucosamine O-acyltransferase [Desulfobacteraceae bacterium]